MLKQISLLLKSLKRLSLLLRGLQSCSIVKYFLKLRPEILAYENGQFFMHSLDDIGISIGKVALFLTVKYHAEISILNLRKFLITKKVVILDPVLNT